jgi:hypothetical protein
MVGSRTRTWSVLPMIPFMTVMVACSGIMHPGPPQQGRTESTTPAAVTTRPVRTGPSSHVVADAHLHYVDFLQQTDGIHKILAAMDSAGVDHAMISGLALMKKMGRG